MVGTLTVGEKNIEVLANAATPIRYNQIFKKDLLRLIGNAAKEDNAMDAVALTPELIFVMMHQAKKSDLARISQNDYISWLEDYNTMDFINAAGDTINFYMGQTATTSKAKK